MTSGSGPTQEFPDLLSAGGRLACAEDGSLAFDFLAADRARLPILVAVPHAGRSYTPEILAAMRHPDAASRRLEDRQIDHVALAVAEKTGCALLTANAPRAMIDLNRAPDDVDWGMVSGGRTSRPRHWHGNRRARSGLGLVPRRLPDLGEIWKKPLPAAELEARIEAIHRPYHQALGRILEDLRDAWGAALLIDLHSMPPLRGLTPECRPAQYVIGDRFGQSCHPRLAAASMQLLAARDRPVAHNRPYSGGYVLDRHAAPIRGLHALQVEVCRASYLDADMDQPAAGAEAVIGDMVRLVRMLADEVAEIGRARRFPLAAE